MEPFQISVKYCCLFQCDAFLIIVIIKPAKSLTHFFFQFTVKRHYQIYRAIAQVVSRWLPTAAERDLSKIKSRLICGRMG
jgi:hypothetical protein